MTRGRKPFPVDDSPCQKRILDALRKVGLSGAGTPFAMRVPELSRAAKIKPTNHNAFEPPCCVPFDPNCAMDDVIND